MHIWGKGPAAGRVRSGQIFCRQSRVGSKYRRVGSGPRKVTRGQLWYRLAKAVKPTYRLHIGARVNAALLTYLLTSIR